jgi:mRNA-degrading endonuclease toxin of MazEF toxin-antitoxin module
VVVGLDPTIGHERHGARPCVLVSDPDVIGDQRFRLVCVVPVTGTPGEGLLYPPIATGQSGLAKRSFALIDQLTALDEGSAVFLGLGAWLHGAEAPPAH